MSYLSDRLRGKKTTEQTDQKQDTGRATGSKAASYLAARLMGEDASAFRQTAQDKVDDYNHGVDVLNYTLDSWNKWYDASRSGLEGVGFGDAGDASAAIKDESANMLERLGQSRKWAQENKDQLGDNYDSIMKMLQEATTGTYWINKGYEGKVEDFGQWGSQAEYDQYQSDVAQRAEAEYYNTPGALADAYDAWKKIGDARAAYDDLDEIKRYQMAGYGTVPEEEREALRAQHEQRLAEITKTYGVTSPYDLMDLIYRMEEEYSQLQGNISDAETYQAGAAQNSKIDGWNMKYGGMDYGQLKQAMESATDPEEKAWLQRFADTKMTRADYGEEIATAQTRMEELDSSLEEYRAQYEYWERLVAQYSQSGDPEDWAKLGEAQENMNSYLELITQTEAEKQATGERQWQLEHGQQYDTLAENSDYKARSGYNVAFANDNLYRFINDRNGMTTFLESGEKYNEDATFMNDNPDYVFGWMTDEEVANYNYLYQTQGRDAANGYLEYLRPSMEGRKTDFLVEETSDFTASGLGGAIVANALSIPMNLAGGVGYLDLQAQNLARKVTGSYAPINYNSEAMLGTHLSQAIRGTTAAMITDKYGVIDLDPEDHPYLAPILNGRGLADVYSLVMSGLDSKVAGVLTGNPAAAAALLATSASTQGVLDALERGATDEQALTMGFWNGVFEALFEYVEVDNLLKGNPSMVKNVVNQAITEGLGEGFTDVANSITDAFLMADKSKVMEDARKYMEENPGMTEKEAIWRAVGDAAIDAGWSMVGGAASGGFAAGAQSMIQNYSGNMDSGRYVQQNEMGDPLMALARSMADGTDYTGKLDTYAQRATARPSTLNMGKLYNEVNKVVDRQNMDQLARALVSKGLSQKEATNLSSAIALDINGIELTKKQERLLEQYRSSEKVMAAVEDVLGSTEYLDRNAKVINMYGKAPEKAATTAQEAPGQAKAAEAKVETTHAVSEDGKTHLIEEPEKTVNIQGIESIKDGKMMLKLEDGSVVDSESVSYGDDGDALVYEILSDMNVSAENANAIYQEFKASNKPAAEFALDLQEAYQYGSFNQTLKEANNSPAAKLAWNEGRMAVISQSDTSQATVEDTYEKATETLKQSGRERRTDHHAVLAENITALSLTESQKASYELADRVAQAVKTDIVVYAGKTGEQGYYDPKTDKVYLNLNATNKSGVSMMAFTLGHELVHRAKKGSPKKYQAFADFLMEQYGKQGADVDAMIAQELQAAKDFGIKMTREQAFEEVVADACQRMLLDTDAGKKLAQFAAESRQNKSFLEDLKRWIMEFMEKLRSIFKDVEPDSLAAQEFAKFENGVKKILADMYVDMTLDAGIKLSAVQAVVKEDAETISSEEIITDGAVVTDGNELKYSIRSMKADIAEGQMFEDLKTHCGWTQKQVDELRNDLEDLVAYMTPFRDILDMNETYGREGRRFSPYKPNNDPLYKISMDFSTLCSKRLLTQYVIENLQLRENRPMGPEEQMAIRDMLNEYRKVEKGLQVACAMCYVEAARLKSPKQISKWIADPAEQVKNFFADKNPEFAAFIKEKQGDFKESRGYDRNATKKDMSAKDVRELNKIRPRVRYQYQLSAEEAEIVERAKALPASTYLTAGNLAELSETDPVIYAAYTTFVRAATHSKSLETDEPYYYGDSIRDNGNGIIVSDSFIEAVNRENGMRFSSWSDWRIQHMLDYITAVIDNSVRGAAMHGYTKFGEEVRVLGKTGMMFNMSGVAGTQTGLNEDGSLSFSPTESIDVNEAIQLREEFPETAGLQCIGVGNDHIRALLRSDIIDYVIPYHVSGLNSGLRAMANIYGWADYTMTQHAAIDKSVKLENAADKEHWREEPVFSEFFVGYDTGMTGIEAMRASADRYVQMCKDRGMKPKFEQFLDEDNYWKLLIDRKMINQKTGKLIRQKPVTPTFDFKTIREVVDRHVQNYDSGLEARALNHIVENWDSIPKRIRDLKKQGGKKPKKVSKAVDTLANETLAAQPKGTEVKGKIFSLPKGNNPYTYDALISKPDMVVTTVGGNVPKNRADVANVAKQNATTVGKFDPKTGSVSVHVEDIDTDVILSTKGLRHGLRRTNDPLNVPNYIVTVKAGEILKNSIRINEIIPSDDNAKSSYVLMGAAMDADGTYVVRFVVNHFDNNITAMDVLYAVNAKKEPAATKSPRLTAKPLSVTGSTISISDLLDLVNQHFPDILPEEVLKHYGYDSRPEGNLGEDALYKLPVGEDTSPRALLANAFEGVVQNDIEKRNLEKYQSRVAELDAEEAKLKALRAEIRELSFAKGPKDKARLSELRTEANATANRISTLDKMLLRFEASAPLQGIIEREKEAVRKRTQDRVKTAVADQRKKAVESMEKRQARMKLDKLVLDTVSWIRAPKKGVAKCPDILKKPYMDFLNGIDTSSQRLGKGGDPTKMDLRMVNAMSALADTVDKITAGQDPGKDSNDVLDAGYLDLPADFVKKLRDMIGQIREIMENEGDRVINSMTAKEVRELSKLIKTLNHAIREMSTLYANQRFANAKELGVESVRFLDSLGQIKSTSGFTDFVNWQNALPYYAFKRFGTGGESVFEGLMDAQDKLAHLAKQIFDFQEKTWTGEEADAWSKDVHTIELADDMTEDGEVIKRSLTLTTADAMSIYCLYQREQGRKHLLGGGVRVIGIQNGSRKSPDSISRLTVEDIDTIIGSLTDRQVKVAAAMQKFMSTVCAEWGNEISMKRFLTREFTESDYFPIESDDENMTQKDPTAQQTDLFRLLNISATKGIDPNANNRAIVRNIFDVFIGHSTDMARLNAFALPLLDYMKWYNYREKQVTEKGQVINRGVRESMRNAYGDAAKRYVMNLIKDVNGRPSDGGLPSFYSRMLKNAKTASVGSSLRVATLQITSYPRAALVLSPKSLAMGLTKVPNIKRAKEYCGIALWKSFGFYDTNIGRSIEDQMKGVKDVKQKLIELSLKGAEIGDAVTWGALWNACEYEVASTKKYEPGTEEFYEAVGKKLREVVYATQVVDSTLTRSEAMRSKDSKMKELTSFMSEPTLSANILMDAGFTFEMEKRRTGNAKDAWELTKGYVGRALAVYSIGQIAAALMEAFWDAWRDDEDEEYWRKFVKAFGENLVLDILPFNKIPIVSDIVEAALSLVGLGYFSTDSLSSSALSQSVTAVKAWSDLLNGKSSSTVYNALYKSMRAVSSILGVSVSGVMREGVALWNNTAGSVDGTLKIRTYEDAGARSEKLYKAVLKGDADEIARLFPDEEKAEEAVRKVVKEKYLAGEISKKEAREQIIAYGGVKIADAYWVLKEWDETKESPADEDYSKYDQFYAAVETGAGLKGVIQEYTANGVSEEALRKQIAEHFKPLYVDMGASGRANLKGYLLNAMEACGQDREKAELNLMKWDFEANYGYTWDDRGDAYRNGAITGSQLVREMMNISGKTQEQAELEVEVYDWQKDIPGCDITSTGVRDYHENCEAVGISRKTFYSAWRYYMDTSGEVDEETGESIPYSKVQKVMPYIDGLDLTAEQKTALALCWWGASTVKKYKTW